MDDLLNTVSKAFEAGQAIIDGMDERFSVRMKKASFVKKYFIKIRFISRQNVENKLQSYLTRAKDTLVLKQIAIPKPAKRPMRTIQDEDEEDEIEPEPARVVVPERTSSQLRDSTDKILRPVRTAKSKASKNLVRK